EIAKGNGTQRTDYAYNDLNPLIEKNYYRLKIFDKNGKITYSNTVLVNIINDKTITVVYPNPAKNILHIQTNGNASFSLLNQPGQILLTTNINGSGSINISGMAAGLYYLKNNSSGAMRKVIVSR
ncbi:MAG TPA: T9SS type A sorting domain-containing protein, partial [Chitinophagaceae bacterium]|nr:T9SS type A sorting domain-containing protein [Chitinophagaceae bacterium]